MTWKTKRGESLLMCVGIRTDVSSVQTEAFVHRQSEHVLGEKEETSFHFFFLCRKYKQLNSRPWRQTMFYSDWTFSCNSKWLTGLMPVSMPTYPAKFVDLKTVWLFFLKLRLTTRGFSFSLMIHDLFFTSQLWRGTSPYHEGLLYKIRVELKKTWDSGHDSYPMNNPKSKFLPWKRLPVRAKKAKSILVLIKLYFK